MRFSCYAFAIFALSASTGFADQREQIAAEVTEGAGKAEAAAASLETEAMRSKALIAFQLELDAQNQREIASQKRLLASAIRSNDDATARVLDEKIKELVARPVTSPTQPSAEQPPGWVPPAANWNATTPSGLANDPSPAPPQNTAPSPAPSAGPPGAQELMTKLTEQANFIDGLAAEKRKQAKENRDYRRAANDCADLLDERAALVRQMVDALKAGNMDQFGKLERKFKSQIDDFVKLSKKYNTDSFLPNELFK